MDIQAYISSGILESYILGTVSSQEKQEVECMSHIYPEIKEELQSLELAMETFATQAKKPVPDLIKANIFAAIDNIPQEQTQQEEVKEAKVVAIQQQPIENNSKAWKWTAAAALLGFVLTTALYLNTNKQIDQYTAQLDQVTEEKIAIEQTIAKVVSEKELTENQLAFLSEKSTSKIVLKGTEAHPENQSIVYWNTESKQGFIKTLNLPVPPVDQDYQLWAIVDGVPVDMGVLTLNTQTDVLQTIPEIANAQAFAITLEKKGGSPTPNLEQLFVIGNT